MSISYIDRSLSETEVVFPVHVSGTKCFFWELKKSLAFNWTSEFWVSLMQSVGERGLRRRPSELELKTEYKYT